MRVIRGGLLSLLLAVLFSLACCGLAPLAAQSSASSLPESPPQFVDGKVYQVPGALLNKLQADLLTAKQELNTLQSLNTQQQERIRSLSEQLAQESTDRLKQLDELQAQLTTASQLLRKSDERTLELELTAGGLGIVAVAAVLWGALK